MADEILRVDKAQTTSRTNGALWIQKSGAATPSTYDDFFIEPDDFLASEQSRLTTNESDISSLDTRVTTLEEGLTKRIYDNRNTSFTVTQNADSRLIEIGFRKSSATGTLTVAVGTGAGLDNIVSSKEVTSERSVNIDEYSQTSRTIYITISGSFSDVVIYSRENVYEI